MQRTVKIISVLATMALAGACSSGSSPTSHSAPGMTIPALESPKADIDVTMGLDAVYGPSANPGYTSYVRFTTAVAEKAGLGAHLNFVRGDFFKDDVLLERFELTGAQIIEETGSNRVEPGGERSFVVMPLAKSCGRAVLVSTTRIPRCWARCVALTMFTDSLTRESKPFTTAIVIAATRSSATSPAYSTSISSMPPEHS